MKKAFHSRSEERRVKAMQSAPKDKMVRSAKNKAVCNLGFESLCENGNPEKAHRCECLCGGANHGKARK